jgi:biopolymer transport protein ExbD
MPTPIPDTKNGGQSAVQSISEIEESGDVVVVRIRRDDQIEVDGVAMPFLGDLSLRLQQLRSKGGAKMGLLVVGHGDATHGTTVAVLDAGYEAGMERVRLAVSDSDGE